MHKKNAFCSLQDARLQVLTSPPPPCTLYRMLTEPSPPCTGNGGWSDWGSWNKTCGSPRTRSRSCNNPTPYCGGSGCGGSSTERTDTCCPVNGGWTGFGDWGAWRPTGTDCTCMTPPCRGVDELCMSSDSHPPHPPPLLHTFSQPSSFNIPPEVKLPGVFCAR